MAASHAPVADAPEGDGGAAAAAPAPDLATVKTMLYSQHSTAPVNQTKTEDWRSLGQVVTTAVKRPDPPVLFSLPLCVERGEIGELMQKRPRSWSNHEHFVLDVQLLIYRAAYTTSASTCLSRWSPSTTISLQLPTSCSTRSAHCSSQKRRC